MRRSYISLLSGAGGVLLLAWLLARQDWSAFGPALVALGSSIVWLALFHLMPLLMDALGWRCLLPRGRRPGISLLLGMRWCSESVNALLPVAQIGGDLLRGHLVKRAGVPGPAAAASIIMDLLLSVLSLAVFLAIGAALLLGRGHDEVAAATLVAGTALGAFCLYGVGMLRRLPSRDTMARRITRRFRAEGWLDVAGQTGAFQAALGALAADRLAVCASSLWQLAAWLAGAGEIWLATHFLGHPVSIADAVLLESLLQAVRNVAFPVPGALGVQDGGLMLLAPLAGIGPELGLLISLARRARELLVGVPGLTWLFVGLRRRGALRG